MKLNKKLTSISAAALMGIAPLVVSNHTVQAADSSTINKTVMHNSAVYDKNGKDTGKMYKSYQKVVVESGIVKINGGQYYKLADKDQYIKITNIDGVERTVEHNAYVYATSTRRANRRLVKKGTTIVTYGGSYKFKDGKRYYRVGGPAKQYVKVANLGDIVVNANNSTQSEAASNANNSTQSIDTNNEETTVTVISPTKLVIPNKYGDPMDSGKALAVGTKFTVDRLEYNKMSQNSSEDEDTGVKPSYYHIKGTDKWINEKYVRAAKSIPNHNIFKEQYTYINFIKDTDVYDAQGNVLDPNGNGQRIIKQLGNIKVNELLYIWLPKENKAELFYHLAGKSFYATKGEWSTITVKDGYVKADDVKYSMGIKLTPSNTPEEAKAAFEASQANTTK